MEWIQQHAAALSVVANFGLLIVWLTYAHLVFTNHRRSLRPRLELTVTNTRKNEAHLLLCNMADGPALVETVMVCLRFPGRGERVVYFNDAKSTPEGESGGQLASKGVLRSGQQINLGPLPDILSPSLHWLEADAREAEAFSFDDVSGFEVRVVAYHGADLRPFAACREFHYHPETGHVQSADLFSRQMYSRKEKRQVMRWLHAFYQQER